MQQEVTYPKKSAYNRTKVVWGIVCLVGPVALIIVTLFIFALINFIASGSSDGFDSSPIKTIMNVILFLVGGFSVITMFPGFIVGIILLATSKK